MSTIQIMCAGSTGMSDARAPLLLEFSLENKCRAEAIVWTAAAKRQL